MRKRRMMAVAGGMVGALVGADVLGLGSLAQGALTISFELASGGTSKVLSAGDVGTDVAVNVYGTVTGGVNAVQDDGFYGNGTNGFGFAYYSARSSLTGTGVDGDITARASAAAFNNTSQLGALADINAAPDGVTDLGSSATISGTNHIKARAASDQFNVDRKYLLSTFSVHINSLSGSPTAGNKLQFLPLLPSLNTVNRAQWWEDGASKTAASNYLTGSGVEFSVATASSFLSVTGTGVGTDRGDVVLSGSGGNYQIQVLDLAGDPTSGFVDLFENNLSTPWGQGTTIVLLDTNGVALPGDINLNGATQLGSTLFNTLNSWAGGGFDVGYSFGSGSKFSFDLGSVALDRIAVVPEPTGLASLGLGALMLMRRRRKD